MSQGQLRVYLGAAPGVGKTYKMLEEGRRRERGTDVVVGYVETHGRKHTEAMLGGLEVMPRVEINYRGHHVHRDGRRRDPGPRPRGRAGRRAGAHQHPRQPQRQALAGHPGAARRRDDRDHHGQRPAPGVDQRRRPADHRRAAAGDRAGRDRPPGRADRAGRHGPGGAAPADGARQHLPPEKVDAALGNYFRAGNLTALRELALLWLADKVDDELDRYRAEHHISATWETRERVVVALTGGPGGRHADPPGGPHRQPGQGSRPARRARDPQRRPGRGRPGQPGPAADAGGEPGRHLPPGRRRRRRRRRCWTSPAA